MCLVTHLGNPQISHYTDVMGFHPIPHILTFYTVTYLHGENENHGQFVSFRFK